MNRSDSAVRSRWGSRVCAAAMTFTLAMGAGAAEVSWPPPEPVQQRLAEALALIDDLEALLPDGAEDLNDLAFELEFEYDRAVALVRERIRFEPYLGVLRGVEGTLATGRGNAWDQALLLASLLKTLGAEAQVVGAPLPTGQAERLLESALAAPVPNEPAYDFESLIERTAQYDEALAESLRSPTDAAADSAALDADTARIRNQLLGLLERADVDVPNDVSVDRRIEKLAADYAWVRWRIGPGDEWIDEHPAFPADSSPELEPVRFMAEEVPEEHLHRVAVQLFIERGSAHGNSRPERVPVMQRYERPVANLYKHQLELGMVPRPSGTPTGGSTLVPMMDGNLAPGAQAVTELGLTADAGDAAGSAGELFATVSTGLGNAASALGEADGGESSVPRLLAVVLVAEVLQPGERPVIIERRIADLRDTALEFPTNAAFGLVLDVGIGDEGGARLTRRMLTQQKAVLGATPALLVSARGGLDPAQAIREPSVRRLDPLEWIDIDLLGPALHPPPSEQRAVFRDGPLLVARRTFAVEDSGMEGGQMAVTDVLFNRATVLGRNDDGELRIAPREALAHGVRETLLESRMARRQGGWSERAPTAILENESALNRASSAWPTASVAQARADLQAGFVLATTDDPEPHWWRIHPETGNTLGMSRYGGSEFTEYVILVGGAIISTYFFFRSVESCDETYPDDREMADCCIVGNLGVTYGASTVAAGRSAWLANPWAAANGKITAELAKETATNVVLENTTGQPIEFACSLYLGR